MINYKLILNITAQFKPRKTMQTCSIQMLGNRLGEYLCETLIYQLRLRQCANNCNLWSWSYCCNPILNINGCNTIYTSITYIYFVVHAIIDNLNIRRLKTCCHRFSKAWFMNCSICTWGWTDFLQISWTIHYAWIS